MLSLHTGDLYTSDAEAIGQGVNCVGVMCAGIAPVIRARYSPQMYREYQQACQTWLLPGSVHIFTDEAELQRPVLANLATQRRPSADARLEWVAASVGAALRILDRAGIGALAQEKDLATTPW